MGRVSGQFALLLFSNASNFLSQEGVETVCDVALHSALATVARCNANEGGEPRSAACAESFLPENLSHHLEKLLRVVCIALAAVLLSLPLVFGGT